MKDFTPDMLEALADPDVVISVCWTITRVDGLILRLTDLDQPITVLGNLYLPNGSTERTAITYTDGISADNIDIRGIFDTDLITEQDLQDGLYNYARIQVLGVFAERPDLRPWEMLRGRLGETEIDRGSYQVKLNSLAHSFKAAIGETTSPVCRAVFGDARCKVPLVDHRITRTISSVTDSRTFVVSPAISNPAKYKFGMARLTNGPAVNQQCEIRGVTTDLVANTSTVTLYLPLRTSPAAGNTLQLDAGCDYTRATCKDVYNNLVNMRAEPDLPGQDELLAPSVEAS